MHRPLPTRIRDTAELPAAYHEAVDAGLAGLGLDLPTAARSAIDGHLRLLLAWTESINLTAIRDPVAAATVHVLDSLSAVPLLRSMGATRVLDLGSGGGLPGIPLAAAIPSAALLVEPIAKKARFLETAVTATGLDARVRVAATRAEALARDPAQRASWPVVTARAVTSLAGLMELALPLLANDGHLVAWKRGDLHAELREAETTAGLLGGATIEVVGVPLPDLDRHRLVVVTRRGEVPDRYPRSPAARRRADLATEHA